MSKVPRCKDCRNYDNHFCKHRDRFDWSFPANPEDLPCYNFEMKAGERQ